MGITDFIRKIFGLPLWAYGVECEICKCSYKTPSAHYEDVKNKKTVQQHEGKIPVLRRRK
jgi:hypothetical protein